MRSMATPGTARGSQRRAATGRPNGTRRPSHDLRRGTIQATGERRKMISPADVPPDRRLAYSISEVAQVTGLSRDLLYDEMRAGRLAYLKVGRRRIITRQQLDPFLTQGAA